MSVIDIFTWILKVAAVVGAVAVIGRAWIWMADTTTGIRQMMQFVPAIKRFLPTLEKLDPLADVLTKEFRPNGGSSIKDRVEKIASQVDLAHSEAAHARAEATAAKKEALDLKREALDLKKAMARQDEVLAKICEGVAQNGSK